MYTRKITTMAMLRKSILKLILDKNNKNKKKQQRLYTLKKAVQQREMWVMRRQKKTNDNYYRCQYFIGSFDKRFWISWLKYYYNVYSTHLPEGPVPHKNTTVSYTRNFETQKSVAHIYFVTKCLIKKKTIKSFLPGKFLKRNLHRS